LFAREFRRAGIDFVGGAIGVPYSEFGFAVNLGPIRRPLAARFDDGYDRCMSNAPESTPSPHDSESTPAEGPGRSPAGNRAETARPQNPLLIFDGDCGFCRRWITRWQSRTGERIDYAPYQEVAEKYPQISLREFASATQLVEPDGRISSGAEAVFRALAQVPGKGWGLWFYRHVPGFAPVSRAAYRFVAGHRRGLSTVTRWLWGNHLEPSTYDVSRRVFIRLVGLIYLIAFASLAVQIIGLVGKNGITPIAEYLPRVHEHLGNSNLWQFPTVFWYDASDGFLRMICVGGAIAAGLVVV